MKKSRKSHISEPKTQVTPRRSMVENKEEDRSGKTSDNFATFIVLVKSPFFKYLPPFDNTRVLLLPPQVF